ncbi:hypothetical protein MGMO_21c00020 [Methyloglobulus morosus KoM1]|uniref:T6SS Phospholipase effector Tle1-like catalytic domain-containing protein n=1 Tax=Methyloglobulus morosus KoM1 TaxID=1116472 RepID=V5C4J9_9GAMM|nr:DUF2235 domain-containing protein [Methyloglobulus morosus]ESS73412.1 hypothetical protein MGMO_21c00020 [Methyloglobulus morosus KoM1]
MPKNIILFSDGTGNTNIKNRGTNVYKLYEAIDFNLEQPKQVAFYDDGVGTQEFKPLKMMGGVFGWGLSRNIRQLYKELVQVYEPDDKIYMFGFSRGAFTIRRLAGLIGSMGILDKTAYVDDEILDNAVWHCFKHYRSKNRAVFEPYYEPIIKRVYDELVYRLPDNELKFCKTKPPIEFVGVWDTVAAVGLPFDGIATHLLDKFVFRFKFQDRTLHPKVKKACHALSIDDERKIFHPLLWEDDPRIEQVWFPGVHANVGGGYPQQGLSLVTLDWMMGKAHAAGLEFVPNDVQYVKDRKYVFDKLYNSRAGMGVYYRYEPRDIAKICNDTRHQISIKIPKIHVSVFKRISQGILGYAPGNLPLAFEVVDDKGKHKNSQKIVDLVNDSIAPNTLLDRTSKYFQPRRILYYTFFVYSVLTLWWLVRWDISNPDVQLYGTVKILISPDGLLDKLVFLVWDHPTLILLGTIIFGGSVYVRKKMEATFSEFWSRLRPRLVDLLK